MTLRGFGILTMATLLIITAFLFGSQFLLSISIFLFLTFTFCGIWLIFHRAKIVILRSYKPQYIYENDEILVSLDISNVYTDIYIEDAFNNGKKNITKLFLPRISKSDTAIDEYKVKVGKRGIYSIGPTMIKSTDFLGLFFRKYNIENKILIRVYPRIYDIPLPQIPLRTSEQSIHMDRNASTLSDDLLGLKEYVIGDDVRLIHWKTSSRINRLFVRQRERQATLPLIMVLDCDKKSYKDENEFDSAARIVGSLSYAAQSHNIPCKLFCNDTGESFTTHQMIMDRLASSKLLVDTQNREETIKILEKSEYDYIFITGSNGKTFSSSILNIIICPTAREDIFNTISLRTNQECSDFIMRIEQWNALASLQSH